MDNELLQAITGVCLGIAVILQGLTLHALRRRIERLEDEADVTVQDEPVMVYWLDGK